jgi:hypothetical protein
MYPWVDRCLSVVVMVFSIFSKINGITFVIEAIWKITLHKSTLRGIHHRFCDAL